MDELLAFTRIGELIAMLRRRDVSPVELLTYYLDRIDDLDPSLNAFIDITSDRALAQAQAAESLMVRGQFLGPLHGIPFALKDLIDVEGMVTSGGSILRNGVIAEKDAFVVRRLFASGAIIIGKTHMVEFAFGGTGINHHYGTPWNPWDLETQRVPGGSSSGSAVAVAAGMVPVALGSDTGGSVRIPASFCGVVGLKPTFGLVSNSGVIPLDPTLDSIGPIAHSVEDCALVHEVLSGPDPRDYNTIGNPIFPGFDAVEGDVKGMRLCFPREYFWTDIDEEVEAAVRASAQVFADLNVHVDEMSIEILDDLSYWRKGPSTTAVESYCYHRELLESNMNKFDPIVSHRMLEGRDVSAVDFLMQHQKLEKLRKKMGSVFETVDFLITPTTPFPAPPLSDVDSDENYPTMNGMCLRNTSAVNLLGLCAISIPCALTRGGLPIGLQLIGRPFDEARLLRLAHAYEQAIGGFSARPDLQRLGI